MIQRRLLFLFAASAVAAQGAVGVRVVLGLTDRQAAKWDGSAAARGARITSIEPYRFDGDDAIVTGDAWRMSTHRARVFGSQQVGFIPVVANGVIVWLAGESEAAELTVKTAQGEFTVRLADIPYGKTIHALDGRAMADRIPPVTRITDSPEEQDYPAAAIDKSGNVWLAYYEFKHNRRHDELRAPMRQAPRDFAAYKEPTGGDQILLRRFAGGAWGAPIAVSRAGGDVYRPAVAIDGSGRAWVFWPGNEKGNFDLWAAVVENGKAGAPMRLTTESGSNIDPVAATDSSGRVWVAWQGWRNGRASIFAATQQGRSMSKAAAISSGAGNAWNPAIAAGGGKVTVAWDSYARGNYDVFMRSARGPGAWSGETAVAATAKYEAYPSLAYDPSGRLWIAYEEGGEGWGKDFGAYETTGVAVYQGRAVQVVVIDKDGKRSKPAGDVSAVLPGPSTQQADSTARQSDSWDWLKPNLKLATGRASNRPEANVVAPRNTLPRLQVDPSGRVWLACRSNFPTWWNPIGTVYTEFVASYDGSAWTGPVMLWHSDNILDNRPALVAPRAGEVLVVASSDGRRVFPEESRKAQTPQTPIPSKDPYNNDLYAATISLPASGGPAAVTAEAAPEEKIGATPMEKTERAAVDAMHAARINGLRITRGEFHRHSEISMDGGGDGTILDQWRYAIDAAALDWIGCCDHDNGGGREYSWWITQKETQIFYSRGKFVPMFNYERSVQYPEGHRNVIFAQRGIRTLPRLPKSDENQPGPAPDTQMLYGYLKAFDGIVASHTSGTNMGTDWRDNDPLREPVVEIYQGERQNYEMPGAPRTNSAGDSIGGWRPKGFVSLALEKGYKMSFQASSDHISTHMSYCNILAADYSREALLDAFKKRHVYASTDNIVAEFRAGSHIMGDAFASDTAPEMRVKLTGTAPFGKVSLVKDNAYVYSSEPNTASVEFTWKDNAPQAGKTSYYYVRGEQTDGNIVWISPMWVTYSSK